MIDGDMVLVDDHVARAGHIAMVACHRGMVVGHMVTNAPFRRKHPTGPSYQILLPCSGISLCCVPKELRPVASSVGMMVYNLLGWFAGPLLTGTWGPRGSWMIVRLAT